MKADDVACVMAALESGGVRAWLDGGWGVDALLGHQTRPHTDLDLVVELQQVAEIRAILHRTGFYLVEGRPPTRFVLRHEEKGAIDVHPVEFNEAGDGVYQMEEGGSWPYPQRGFLGRGNVNGTPVDCLTAEVQVLCHDGYEYDAEDRHDVMALIDAFSPEVPLSVRTRLKQAL